ncbi:integrin beta-7-like, partial [Carcharodon carcharias]|uniref:integrin beta-7-like n=1 Tax=Carcharodon carcharias TaxID=13397 RepID=UPI001B7F0A48
FGSFVDKTVLPYISMLPQKYRNPCPDRTEQCQPPFSFRNVLPLTDNATEFEEKVSQQNISGNLDPPEGGLDAVMQAAVCGKEVRWRNVTRLLVYTSDATFHTAGDGRLGGIFLPNDGHCHLDPSGLYSESQRYDYPSVGHLAQTLAKQNIQPIFAVTENTLHTYQELSKLIPKSVVAELKEDSSNVLQLITEAYGNLSSTINLEHSKLPDGVSVRFESHCRNQTIAHSGRAECLNVRINEEVRFTVTVSASALSCSWSRKEFELRVLGFTEKLEVQVETVCGCECGDGGIESDDMYCSHGIGKFSCGQCSCSPGYLGKACECSQENSGVQDLSEPCRKEKESALCGGRGHCLCGVCICNHQLRGRFCECDDHSCTRHNNNMCSGNGECVCGTCHCNSSYTGEACECSMLNNACQVAEGPECSGHGQCKCNRCQCESGYQGATCETCVTCPTECEQFKDCAECSARQSCRSECLGVTVQMVRKFPEGTLPCAQWVDDGELLEFVVLWAELGSLLLVRERAPLSDKTFIIITSVMAGIVLIGLVSLVIWRGLLELYDRREYHRFETERQNARWNESGNPLFKSATTTVVNPQYMEE